MPPAPTPDRESKAVVSGTDRRNDVRAQYRTTRLIAVVAGLLGTLFAVLTPFLLVTQDDASIGWPQNGTLDSVDAPLMSQVPQSMSVTVPCTAVAALPAGGGLLLSTAPARGEGAALNAMFVRVSDTSVDVLDRNVAIASAPRSQVESSACTAIRFDSDITATTAAFEGLTDDAGVPRVGRLDVHAVEHHRLGAERGDLVGDPLRVAGGRDAGVGEHQHPAGAVLLQVVADLLGGAAAELQRRRAVGEDGLGVVRDVVHLRTFPS